MESADRGVRLEDVETARCFGCRNRFGVAGLVVLDSGVLCCQRCSERRELHLLPDVGGGVEVVG